MYWIKLRVSWQWLLCYALRQAQPDTLYVISPCSAGMCWLNVYEFSGTGQYRNWYYSSVQRKLAFNGLMSPALVARQLARGEWHII